MAVDKTLTQEQERIVEHNKNQRYVYNRNEAGAVTIHRETCEYADAENDRGINLTRALRDYSDHGCPTCLPFRIQEY